MSQTTTSSSTRKYAQQAQQNAQLNKRNKRTKFYKRVMVKLVRLLSARPAAVSLVATGLSLPNPL